LGASQQRIYYYDGLGRLTYDGLGRLTKEINPETGTTQYFWDAAPAGCYNGYATPSDLGAKRDNAGVFSCNRYDEFHSLPGLAPATVLTAETLYTTPGLLQLASACKTQRADWWKHAQIALVMAMEAQSQMSDSAIHHAAK
jgi:hypothetical protein